ncbi:putative mif domain-containing protein [Erysiphe neolycopersici]|uniref:L-dopachrome isomerase n=1 Tax=Erysiphe neolycopersici TaxID=212602 RepID=A0A420H7H1_9PEZI|nr:putative mif domain-containing protein [Erysiphe neolycopersici]
MPASARSSFEELSNPPSPSRSFARRVKLTMLHSGLPPSPVDSNGGIFDQNSATVLEEKRLTREITRGTPGDRRRSMDTRSPLERDLARKRSQYYENAFAVDPRPAFTARDRVLRESFIMADIKTNIVINDEFKLVTDISYALSTRYQRPENSILVTLSHSCCLLLGGNFEPAYVLNVTALPSQVLPITNRRNSFLLAKVMEDALGVSAERGIIKFTAISEDSLAYNGRTVAREIEELEKSQHENQTLGRNLSSHGTIRSRRRPSIKSLRGYKAHQLHTHDETMISTTPTPLMSKNQNPSSKPERPAGVLIMEHQPDRLHKVGRRRSFIASIFGRT